MIEPAIHYLTIGLSLLVFVFALRLRMESGGIMRLVFTGLSAFSALFALAQGIFLSDLSRDEIMLGTQALFIASLGILSFSLYSALRRL